MTKIASRSWRLEEKEGQHEKRKIKMQRVERFETGKLTKTFNIFSELFNIPILKAFATILWLCLVSVSTVPVLLFSAFFSFKYSMSCSVHSTLRRLRGERATSCFFEVDSCSCC